MILHTVAAGHENLNIYSSVSSISLFRPFGPNPPFIYDRTNIISKILQVTVTSLLIE